MLRANDDFIGTLAESARRTISEGYYQVPRADLPHRSLRDALARAKGIPLITEVKFRSPSEGQLRKSAEVREIAQKFQRGGASGISVLTEPKHFDGRIEYLTAVKRSVEIPVLMKDVIVDPLQVDAAERAGADAILLMDIIFRARLSAVSLEKMVQHAHERGLEVVLEAHTEREYLECLESQADIVGINNRNLKNLKVSLDTSRELLKGHERSKLVICESGFSKPSELLELQALGAGGFLVGSSLMKSGDIEAKTRELVGAT